MIGTYGETSKKSAPPSVETLPQATVSPPIATTDPLYEERLAIHTAKNKAIMDKWVRTTGSPPADAKATASPRQSRRTRGAVKVQVQVKATGSTTITGESTILGFLPEGSMILDKVHADLYRRQGFEIRRLEEELGKCRSKAALQAGHFKP